MEMEMEIEWKWSGSGNGNRNGSGAEVAWSRRGPASSSCPKCSSPSNGTAGAGSTSHSPSLASSPFHPLPFFPSPSPPAPVPAAGGCGARRGTSVVPFPWWLRRRPAAGGSYSGPGSMAGGTGTGGSGDRAQLGCGAGTPQGKTPQGAGGRGTTLSAHTPHTVQAGNGEEERVGFLQEVPPFFPDPAPPKG